MSPKLEPMHLRRTLGLSQKRRLTLRWFRTTIARKRSWTMMKMKMRMRMTTTTRRMMMMKTKSPMLPPRVGREQSERASNAARRSRLLENSGQKA